MHGRGSLGTVVSNTATGCRIVVSGKELFVVVWLAIVRMVLPSQLRFLFSYSCCACIMIYELGPSLEWLLWAYCCYCGSTDTCHRSVHRTKFEVSLYMHNANTTYRYD